MSVSLPQLHAFGLQHIDSVCGSFAGPCGDTAAYGLSCSACARLTVCVYLCVCELCRTLYTVF